jgi:hypothetical protein
MTTDSQLARIHDLIRDARPATVCTLRSIYDADPELLYLLATTDANDHSSEWTAAQRQARTLSVMLRDGYEVSTRGGQYVVEGTRGGWLVLDDPIVDRRFIDSLFKGGGQKKTLQGNEVSDGYIDFRLKAFPWDEEIRRSLLFRLAAQDATAVLGGLPAYQRFELLDCVRQVVQAPSAVFDGVKTDSPRNAMVFCGKPNKSWRNDGRSSSPRDGYVYVVYCEGDTGYVYDWDWVQEDSVQKGLPINWKGRFGPRATAPQWGDVALGMIRNARSTHFAPGAFWCSITGDCVFHYVNDAESYAVRIDPFITGFKDFDTHRSVGFKLKAVSRLLARVRFFERTTGAEFVVEVDPNTYEVTISALMHAWIDEYTHPSRQIVEVLPFFERMQQVQELIGQLDDAAKVAVPRVVLERAESAGWPLSSPPIAMDAVGESA